MLSKIYVRERTASTPNAEEMRGPHALDWNLTLLSYHVYRVKMDERLNLRPETTRRIKENHFKMLLLVLIFCVTPPK